ncbi:MAG: hypothetical protein ACRBN8_27635 [Nannocystales bacterium]
MTSSTAEFVDSSGDSGALEDGTYSRVVTESTWGGPRAVERGRTGWFPPTSVVNRFHAAALDLSNAGFGVSGGVLNVLDDIIRNKLSAKPGGGVARSNLQPVERANFIGAEDDLNVSWRIMPMRHISTWAATTASPSSWSPTR